MRTTYLPNDLIRKIFMRLPAKSLIRFKCGCKSWCELISDPTFLVKSIVSKPTEKNSHLLVQHRNQVSNEHAYSLLSYDTLEVSPYEAAQGMPHANFQVMDHWVLVGSFNGIVCLCRDDDDYAPHAVNDIILWNPATSEMKVLPESQVPILPEPEVRLTKKLGFGYDERTNDYKVISLSTLAYDYCYYVLHVEVYSLNTDSWRAYGEFESEGVDVCERCTCYGPGAFSWHGSADGRSYPVLSFDMSTEVLHLTKLPDLELFTDGFVKDKALFMLNGSITMIVTVLDNDVRPKRFDVWVLLEFGVKESWTKLISTGPLAEIEWPSGLWKNGEVFLETSRGQLVLYDPFSREMKDLHVHGAPKSVRLVTYRKTLVSIEQRND